MGRLDSRKPLKNSESHGPEKAVSHPNITGLERKNMSEEIKKDDGTHEENFLLFKACFTTLEDLKTCIFGVRQIAADGELGKGFNGSIIDEQKMEALFFFSESCHDRGRHLIRTFVGFENQVKKGIRITSPNDEDKVTFQKFLAKVNVESAAAETKDPSLN